jgi:hypothetical protein
LAKVFNWSAGFQPAGDLTYETRRQDADAPVFEILETTAFGAI